MKEGKTERGKGRKKTRYFFTQDTERKGSGLDYWANLHVGMQDGPWTLDQTNNPFFIYIFWSRDNIWGNRSQCERGENWERRRQKEKPRYFSHKKLREQRLGLTFVKPVTYIVAVVLLYTAVVASSTTIDRYCWKWYSIPRLCPFQEKFLKTQIITYKKICPHLTWLLIKLCYKFHTVIQSVSLLGWKSQKFE